MPWLAGQHAAVSAFVMTGYACLLSAGGKKESGSYFTTTGWQLLFPGDGLMLLGKALMSLAHSVMHD